MLSKRWLAGSVVACSLSLISRAMSFSAKATTPKNIVVVGGGIQGVSCAYHLAKQIPTTATVTILEAKATASAASGKGGGFMARSWGNGSPTQRLHELAFDMYEEMAKELKCESYRKLPVLSVSPGYQGIQQARKNREIDAIFPEWLDGDVGRISALGYGDDTAQITPKEFVDKMIEDAGDKIKIVLGTCTGVETEQGSERGNRKVTAVKYQPRSDKETDEYLEEQIMPADCVIVSAGPWSCAAEDWFQGAVQLPMEGIKSTSIVWKQPEGANVDATALFCGEDNRFGTHRKLSSSNISSRDTVYCVVILTERNLAVQSKFTLAQTEAFIFVVLEDQTIFPQKISRKAHFAKHAMPTRRE